MKFAYIFAIFMAAFLTSALPQPLTDQEEFPEDYTSGNVTGAIGPQLLSETLATRALEKRSNAEFWVYTSGDCTSGGIGISVTGSGVKDDFGVRNSMKLLQLTNGWHLTLYTGKKQSGVLTRFYAGEVGANNCWVGSWQSYGVYSS